MDGIEYEFVGNQTSVYSCDILFRSHGDDNSLEVGEVRYIHNEIYYCSERMTAMVGTFYYWTPVDKTVNKNSVLQDLIKELSE
jgi:hypothetical protein